MNRFYHRDKARKLTESVALDIFKGPYLTEKSAHLSQENIVVLQVALDANKIDIKAAFEMVFGIKVETVRTITTKPKMRSFKGEWSRRSPIKKAIIQVEKGQDISKMLGVEE
jgi:large subunit ribosomal protein L23